MTKTKSLLASATILVAMAASFPVYACKFYDVVCWAHRAEKATVSAADALSKELNKLNEGSKNGQCKQLEAVLVDLSNCVQTVRVVGGKMSQDQINQCTSSLCTLIVTTKISSLVPDSRFCTSPTVQAISFAELGVFLGEADEELPSALAECYAPGS